MVFAHPKKTIRLFDKYNLAIPTQLKCHEDGIPGRRVLFISDSKDNFNVSFEEGMNLMDMLPDVVDNIPTVSYQYRKGGKYIHLRRNHCGRVVYAFFHIELLDADGKMLCLPGQMVVDADYKWSDGIEPVLIELMEGLIV